MKYALQQASRIGGRRVNQDRVGYWATPECLLLAVADGLGGYESPRPDAPSRERLAEHDIVLLCSDGFWNPLTQRQLLHLLATRELEQAVTDLAHLAEIRAGPDCDNVSVIAMRWGEAAASVPAVPESERTVVQDLTATDLDFLRVSDEDIERAIAELKAVLRKSSSS